VKARNDGASARDAGGGKHAGGKQKLAWVNRRERKRAVTRILMMELQSLGDSRKAGTSAAEAVLM